MESEFASRCAVARNRIDVPTVPLERIRQAARERDLAPRTVGKGGFGKLLFGTLLIAGTAGAAVVYNGTHLAFDRSGTVRISTERFTFVKDPTPSQIRAAVERTDFPVILPVGLPGNAEPITLAKAGTSALIFQYNLPGAWRRSDHLLWIIVANPKTLASTQLDDRRFKLVLGGSAAHGAHLRIGAEEVSIFADRLTPGELAQIEATMQIEAGQR